MIATERDQIRRRMILASILFVAAFVIGTFGYYALGQAYADRVRWPLGDCAYMTAVTLSTVGYEEVLKLKEVPGARGFTVGLLLFGLATAVYFSSALTTFLVEGEFQHIRTRRKMKKLLDSLQGHVVVCGAGRAGTRAAEELVATRTPFCAIDLDQERLHRLQGLTPKITIPTVLGSALEDDVLREAGIDRALGIICALPDDRDNLYLTVSARQLNPRLRIVAKGDELGSIEKLRRAGADTVVTPALIGGLRMVSEMIRPLTVQFLDLMMHDRERNMRIEDLSIPPASPLVGKLLRDDLLRAAGPFLVLAVKDEGQTSFEYAPDGEHVLRAGTKLVLLAAPETMQRLRSLTGN